MPVRAFKEKIMLLKTYGDNVAFDRALSEIETNYASNEELMLLRANELFAKEKISEAEQALLAFVQKFPHNSQAYILLGNIYGRRNANAEAIMAFNKALAIHPFNVQARMGRAIANAQAGSLDDALSDLDKVLQEEPQNTDAWFNRAIIYFNRNDRVWLVSICRRLLNWDINRQHRWLPESV